MSRNRPRRNKRHTKPVIYHTPGRECSHANKGCCPRCMAGPKVLPILTYPAFAESAVFQDFSRALAQTIDKQMLSLTSEAIS